MVLYILLSVFFGWLIILTYYLIKVRTHYDKLTAGGKFHHIDKVLEKLIGDDERATKEIQEIKREVGDILKRSTVYVKKIGMVKFNPFGRSEGEKSFVISLLNGEESGVVVNFIYTHEGLRVYAKKVLHGKGEEYELSEEEKRSLQIAK